MKPAAFKLPLGPTIPLAAIAFALAILAGASGRQIVAGLIALAVGGILYVIAVRGAGGRGNP